MSTDGDERDQIIDAASNSDGPGPHPLALSRFGVARFFERFAFYTMRHWLIVLFMTKAGGGADANAFYTYFQYILAAVVFAQIPGGLAIDLFYSRRKALVWGGALIAVGYFILAADTTATTILAALCCIVGSGLYGGSSISLLGSFYTGRSQYLDAGMCRYIALVNAGAFAASLFTVYAATVFNWQQGCMVAGILMMVGHVYLLAVSRVFSEPKLKATAEKKKANRNLQSLILGAIMIGFVGFSFSLQSGYGMLSSVFASVGGHTGWPKVGSFAATAGVILALLIGSEVLTARPGKVLVRLGYGLFLALVIIAASPLFMQLKAVSLPDFGVVGISVFLVVALAVAEFLTLPPLYAFLLRLRPKYLHTLLGLVASVIHIPYLAAVSGIDTGGAGTVVLILLAVIVCGMAALTAIRFKNEIDI